MSIRSELIRELEQNRTKPVSGQKLAQRLHVSRNAVCKMIHTLNEEGFEIASFPRKGYQLAETSNKLSAEAVSYTHLWPQWQWKNHDAASVESFE